MKGGSEKKTKKKKGLQELCSLEDQVKKKNALAGN